MTSKLPWVAAVLIIAAALGTWAIYGGAPPAQPTQPTTPPTVPGWSSISVVGIPAGSKSGIIAVYAAKTGQDNTTDNWNTLATSDNYYVKWTATETSTGTLPYDTPFIWIIEVVGHDDNMAYRATENLNVELTLTSTFDFSMSAENAGVTGGLSGKVTYDDDAANSEIGVYAIWDNYGNGYQVPADESMSFSTRLLLYA